MGVKIAAGFHACVDFELEWDKAVLEELIARYDIREEELTTDLYVDSERQLLVASLGHMKQGMGGEFIPETPEICFDFAQQFRYKVTVGGTAARAAIAISKLGYESALSMVCYNHYIAERMPEQVHYFSNIGEAHEEIYPHVILSYPAGEHICANGIDFVTPRENRLMYSRDIDSLNMVISQEFAPYMKDAEVMLLSCFSEVLDRKILEDRMVQTRMLLETLPEHAYVVLEDGCYINKEFRLYVHEQLRNRLDVLSMNEDEMQEYVGRRIDIMNPEEVLDTIQYLYENIKVPTLIVHSAYWAVACGRDAQWMAHVLENGIALSSTRFQYGDEFGTEEFEKTKQLPAKKEGVSFSTELTKRAGGKICCVPTKDLSFVRRPVAVGLGDFFAGGLLPELTLEKRGAIRES